MKRLILLAVVAVLALTVAAQASSVSFSWGANFRNFQNTNLKMTVGTASQVEWYADDFGMGLRSESSDINGTLFGDDLRLLSQLTQIVVDKWLSKSVAVGLGFGSGVSQVWYDGSYMGTYRSPVVDIRGTVQLLSGKGEKVNASLDFNLAARWLGTTLPDDSNLNGTVATLAVTLGL